MQPIKLAINGDIDKLDDIVKISKKLKQQYYRAKSIKDLQKEAFEAGRKYRLKNTYEFETFEDYLKSKEDGTTNS